MRPASPATVPRTAPPRGHAGRSGGSAASPRRSPLVPRSSSFHTKVDSYAARERLLLAAKTATWTHPAWTLRQSGGSLAVMRELQAFSPAKRRRSSGYFDDPGPRTVTRSHSAKALDARLSQILDEGWTKETALQERETREAEEAARRIQIAHRAKTATSKAKAAALRRLMDPSAAAVYHHPTAVGAADIERHFRENRAAYVNQLGLTDNASRL